MKEEYLRCNTCEHCYTSMPDLTSPYGECACLAKNEDLVGVNPKDVENCSDYKKDKKEVLNDEW